MPGAVTGTGSTDVDSSSRRRAQLTRATGANFGYFFGRRRCPRTPGDQTSARSTGCGRARRVRSRFRCSHRSKGIPRLCSRAAPEGSETEGMERRCHGPPRLPLGSRQSRARASPRRWRSCFSRSSRSSGAIPGSARPLWAPARGRRRAVTGTPPRARPPGRTRIVGEDAPSSGTTTSRANVLDVFDPAQRPRADPGARRARRRRLGRHQVPAGVLLQPRVLAVFFTSRCRAFARGAGHVALLDRARPRRGHGGVRP